MQSIDKLLYSKMNPPRIGMETIWRKRLIENFSGIEYKKLTIVTAPTGYGKTVLVSQFAYTRNNPVVWYHLDEFDNDFTLFIKYFIAGISKKIPHFGIQTLDFIEKNEDISQQVRLIVALLVNELQARAKEGLTFIMDDYHVINEKLIHKFIEEIIQCLPEGVHLIVSSRYALPLNVARLKAHGLVNEITYNHLRFSKEEIITLFNSQKESNYTDDIIEKFQLETDGWAVALSLIKSTALSLENSKKNTLIQWKNREEIYNYFAEEVFQQLPIELQMFLIDTSVLDFITPDICNILTEREDSNDLLEKIIKQNIFLTKFEGEEVSYRYHHLFKDFLEKHLGDRKKMLLEKAGGYFADKEYYEQAVESYILADIYEKAVSIIKKSGLKMIKAGNWQTINRWIQKIPKGFVEKSPQVILLKGVIYNHKGMLDKSLLQIEEALKLFILYNDMENLLNGLFQKSVILRKVGHINESLEVLNEILSSANDFHITKWYDAVLEKVNTLLWSGKLNEAVETLEVGIEFAKRDEEHKLIAYFLEHVGATYYALGEYFKAIEYYNESRERYFSEYDSISEFEEERYSQRTTLSSIYRDWGELDKALKLIQEEISTKERLGLIDDLPRAYHQLALICNDLGDKETAEKHFQYADEMYKKLGRRDFQWTWHLAVYGKILMDNGKREKGKELIEKAIEYAEKNSDFNLAICEFIGCYAYIDDIGTDGVLKLLEHALEVAEKVGAKNLICQCNWALSNFNSIIGNREKAKNYAIRCFSLAREGNYLQIFLSYEQIAVPIIKLGIELEIEEEFLEKVILRLGSKSKEMLVKLIENNEGSIKHRSEKLFAKVKGEEKKFVNKEIASVNSTGEVKEKALFHVCCFGNFEVYGEGETIPVQWKTTKAMELFAYLITNSNKIINKERILENIWSDMDPEQTSKWLYTYIYQIRNAMKIYGIENGLIYKNKGYCLVTNNISSDVNEFENLIDSSMIEEMETSIECLKKAILLYKGEYLDGFYNDWIVDEKNRLENLYQSALERLSKIYMEVKEYKLALKYLIMILKKDPLSENAHEMLMIAYERMGDRMALINQYEVYCKTLKDELGVEPKKEMKDLFYKLTVGK